MKAILAFLGGGVIGAPIGLFIGAMAVNVLPDAHIFGMHGYEATGIVGMVLGFVGLGMLSVLRFSSR